MKKNIMKITTLLLIVLMMLGIASQVFALNPDIGLITPETEGKTGENTSKIVNIIVGTIQIIGVAVAIIMLVFLAIKYVSAAPSEKADIKKGAVIYIVGAVFLFGASVILGFVRDFITQIGG